MHRTLLCALIVTPILIAPARAESPRVMDDRLKIELFAEHPDIVTPTGIAIDAGGRVLAIESHTHFRPENYPGPATDRIQAFEDTDDDGKADRVTTFYSGTEWTMSLAVYHDGSVFVATRSEVFRLRDTTGDGRADQRIEIARLDTAGDYPHNGLSGFAFDYAGNVYFGFGENLGADYTLRGTDGKSLSGGGEGGNIYRCRPDGSRLEQVATGFWNPFHLCFDAFGRLFAVDNDPDSRPPCRLLHIVPRGDYGYRFRNGRKGLHPFTAWNGELPGTLPMVAGTGEAPSGIVAYESDGLPDEYRGRLLVTSWGDHRIDSFSLRPRGASYRASSRPLVTGDENFRPVGITVAPDGSLYVTDWVDESYTLHGKGRIWRITWPGNKKPQRPQDPRAAIASAHRPLREGAARSLAAEADGRSFLRRIIANSGSSRARATALGALAAAGDRRLDYRALMDKEESDDVRAMAVRFAPAGSIDLAQVAEHDSSAAVRSEAVRRLSREEHWPVLLDNLTSSDPFIRHAARWALARVDLARFGREHWQSEDAARRLQMLLLGWRTGQVAARRLLPQYLRDADPAVRFAAVQWVGEEGLSEHRRALADGLAAGPATPQLFAAYLAALEKLDGTRRKPTDESAGQDYVAKLLLDPATSLPVRRRALRMLPPDHPALSVEQLQSFLALPDERMQLEAIRALCDSPLAGAPAAVEVVARDAELPSAVRAAAVTRISGDTPRQLKFLLAAASGLDRVIAREALRSLRGTRLDDQQREQLRSVASRDRQTKELITVLLDGNKGDEGPPPTDIDAWLALLNASGDPAAGERVFFHPRGPGCYKCHQVDGRGIGLGPDLSATTAVLSRRRLIESILQPSKEIAPQFVPWSIETVEGKALVGMMTSETAAGEQTYVDTDGNTFTLRESDIDRRQQRPVSIMPDDLHRQLTPGEFRDLLAYLHQPR